jgi:hypothetical protein
MIRKFIVYMFEGKYIWIFKVNINKEMELVLGRDGRAKEDKEIYIRCHV